MDYIIAIGESVVPGRQIKNSGELTIVSHDTSVFLIHLTKDGKELEERARVIANQTLKEALKGITIEELSVSQEVLRKIFFNTKD